MFPGLSLLCTRISIFASLFAVGVPAAHAQSTQVTRGPYLQMGTPSSVVARWRTDTSTDSMVRYGLAPDNLSQSASVNGSTTEHAVTLTGLNSNTRYYYSVGNSSGALAGGDDATYFETGPPIGTPQLTRIWVIGDSGTANNDAIAVYDAYRSYAGSTYTNLWLMLGDNAYDDGTDSEYQDAVFDIYPELLRQTVVWPTLGNHDGHAADSASETGPYYDIFTLPRQGDAGGVASGTEAYYSFDYANIHFVVLDSYESNREPGGAMLTWLESDLQAATADWLIAYWHHPPYTKGSHDSDTEGRLIDMRENVLPILEDYGVDLVFAGHSHSYERSILLDGHYGDSDTLTAAMMLDEGDGRTDGDGAYTKATEGLAAHEGAVYIVAGSSGKISGGSLNHPAMHVSMSVLGSVILDVDDFTLNATFIDENGAVTDYFTLLKGDGSGCAITEPSEQSCSDGLDNDCDGVTDGMDTDCCPDSDGDGYTDVACGGLDCNDGNANVSPGALESCGDLVDNDCNGNTDCDDQSCTGHPACCADADGDGYTDVACGGTDCRDDNGAVNPGAAEICDDSQDNNCNDLTDCAEQSCAGVGGCPAEPRTVIVTDISDSFVRDLDPSSNYGTSDSLEVDTASVYKYALIKPNDLGDIEPGAQVVSAELVLNIFNPGDTVQVQEILASWNETTVTYDNAPSASLTTHTTFAGNVGEVSIDITSIAQGWVNGESMHGLRLYPTDSDGVDIRSSDYSDSALRPYFVFEVLESSGGGCDDGDGDGYADITCGGTDCVDDNASINPGAAEVCDDLLDNDCDSATDCDDGECADDRVCGGGQQRIVFLTNLDDALVRDVRPNSNYGDRSTLDVDTESVFKQSFIKPNDLSDIAPGALVVSAELVLRLYNPGDTVQVREVLESWTEGTVTWNNAPDASSALTTFPGNTTGEVAVDVTSLMQRWVDGASVYGVNLYPTGTDGVDIRSTEYWDSSQRPYYVVEVIE